MRAFQPEPRLIRLLISIINLLVPLKHQSQSNLDSIEKYARVILTRSDKLKIIVGILDFKWHILNVDPVWLKSQEAFGLTTPSIIRQLPSLFIVGFLLLVQLLLGIKISLTT